MFFAINSCNKLKDDIVTLLLTKCLIGSIQDDLAAILPTYGFLSSSQVFLNFRDSCGKHRS